MHRLNFRKDCEAPCCHKRMPRFSFSSMANRLSTKIISPKPRLSETPLPSKQFPSSEKVTSNQKSSQDGLSRFLQNINYEYFRREFTSVKEKFKDSNRKVILANPSSDIGSKRPLGMKKFVPHCIPSTTMAAAPSIPRGSRGGGGGGYKLFVLKSLIGIVTVYSTVKLGIWGTPDDTQELVTKFTTGVREGKFTDKVNNLSTFMSEIVTNLSESATTFVKYSTNYLKEKFGKK